MSAARQKAIKALKETEYEYPTYSDDGAGVSLFTYPKADVEHDYQMMLPYFGADDFDVQNYKKVLDNWERYNE